MRQREDSVCTFIKTTETPVMSQVMKEHYWTEISTQVTMLIGLDGAVKLAKLIAADPVKLALYHKSEQSRVDLIIYLQRSGQL